MILERKFYMRDTLISAKELLGKTLVHETSEGTTKGIIVETEAYLGKKDRAAHAYKGNTERTRVLFSSKGCSYVYLIYGIYCCFNISSGPADNPECILIRALEPVYGIEIMDKRRGGKGNIYNLCSGPGKLSEAMGITRDEYGIDLTCRESGFYVEDTGIKVDKIKETTRIGVDYAGEDAALLYRFYIEGNKFISRK